MIKHFAFLWGLLLLAATPVFGSFVLAFEDTTNGGMAVIVDNRPNGYAYDGANSSNTNDDNWTGPTYADGVVGVVESPVGLQVGNFAINFAAGFSSNLVNPTGLIDLNLSVTSTGAGTLRARLTKTDFANQSPQFLVSHIGGAADPGTSLIYTAGLDPAAGFFVQPAGSTTAPFSTSAAHFDDTRTLQLAPTSTFSLTQEFLITATGSGQTLGFDAELTTRSNLVPEPSGLATFICLVAWRMGMLRLRRSRD